MAKIIYIRHGQASLFSDNYDNLSERGWKQSELLGTYLKEQNIKISKVYLGPLQRHRQTLEGIEKGLRESLKNIETLHGLIEHDGPKVKRHVLAELIKSNQEIHKLSILPEESITQKVHKHVEIYNAVTKLWVSGKLNQDLSSFMNWKDFREITSKAFDHIKTSTQKGETILAITSGGPVSVTTGQILNLSDEETINVSHQILNSSITEFLVSSNQCSLLSFNTTPHLTLYKEMQTII